MRKPFCVLWAIIGQVRRAQQGECCLYKPVIKMSACPVYPSPADTNCTHTYLKTRTKLLPIQEHSKYSPSYKFAAVLRPSNISGHMRMGTNWWPCTLMVTLNCCPTGRQGFQHHDLISHSLTLSWYWASQSFSYPNNVKSVGRKRWSFSQWFDSTKVRTRQVWIAPTPKTGEGRSTHLITASGP